MQDTLKTNVLKLLDDLSLIYEKDIRYKENLLGMYTHIHLSNTGENTKEFNHEELSDLNKVELESLVDFGFKLNGINTEKMYRGSDVFFVRIENRENNYEDAINKIENIINKEVNDRYTNYIIIEDITGDLLINYDIEFVTALEELQNNYNKVEKLMVMYFNLEGNYLNENHKTECLRHNNLSLDEDIGNLNELILMDNSDVKYYNKDVLLSKEAYDSLGEEEVFRLAYFALKHKVNLIFGDNTIDNEFRSYCRILFSGRHLPIDKGIKFRRSLKNNVVIKCVGGRGCMPIVIGGPMEEFKVNCVPIDDIINATDIEALVLMLEPYKVSVNMDNVFNMEQVLEIYTLRYAEACKGTMKEIKTLQRARVETLKRFQEVCVRILENNSVSIRNMIAFNHDDKIFLGSIQREDIQEHVEKVTAYSFTNVTNEVYTTKIDIMDTLPTQLFLTDRVRETDYTMVDLDIEDLDAMFYGGKGPKSSSQYTAEGEYCRAVYSVKHGIDSRSDSFYETCIRIDEDLVKGTYVFDSGEISIRLKMAP